MIEWWPMLSVLVFSMSLMMLLVDPYLRQGKQKELTCVCVLFFLPDLTPPRQAEPDASRSAAGLFILALSSWLDWA